MGDETRPADALRVLAWLSAGGGDEPVDELERLWRSARGAAELTSRSELEDWLYEWAGRQQADFANLYRFGLPETWTDDDHLNFAGMEEGVRAAHESVGALLSIWPALLKHEFRFHFRNGLIAGDGPAVDVPISAGAEVTAQARFGTREVRSFGFGGRPKGSFESFFGPDLCVEVDGHMRASCAAEVHARVQRLVAEVLGACLVLDLGLASRWSVLGRERRRVEVLRAGEDARAGISDDTLLDRAIDMFQLGGTGRVRDARRGDVVALRGGGWLSGVLREVISLASSTSDDATRLRWACLRFLRSYAYDEPAERAASLCGILEGALLDGNELTAIGARLREAVGHLVGRSLQERKEIRSLINQLYNIRSNFVHSGKRVGDSQELVVRKGVRLTKAVLAAMISRWIATQGSGVTGA